MEAWELGVPVREVVRPVHVQVFYVAVTVAQLVQMPVEPTTILQIFVPGTASMLKVSYGVIGMGLVEDKYRKISKVLRFRVVIHHKFMITFLYHIRVSQVTRLKDGGAIQLMVLIIEVAPVLVEILNLRYGIHLHYLPRNFHLITRAVPGHIESNQV
ncbi:MAG TPA: hypothetical protein PKH50_01705 [bacterium]|jgi:hypothetical protein|nr:hypothetical protein [bacterium]